MTEKNHKLLKSAGISLGAVASIYVLAFLFPDFDWLELRTAVLTAVSAWIINTVREYLK